MLGALGLQGELFHVQGVELDGQHIWVTSVDTRNHRGYLHEFDQSTGVFLRRIDLTDGARFHPGGISISGGSLWVPVSEYRSHSSAVINEVDIETLRIKRQIKITDHIGCVAANGHNLVAGNWDSKQLYILDLRNPGQLRTASNPSGTSYQDMKFSNGHLVASGVSNWQSGSIDWIDFPSMQLVQTLRTGATGPIRLFDRARPYSAEGMTLQGSELYLLPEDGPSRLFHFQLDDSAVSGSRRNRPGVDLAVK